jgi:hypothetical protein
MTLPRLSLCWLAFCCLYVEASPTGTAAQEPNASTTEEQGIAADIDRSLDDASNSTSPRTSFVPTGVCAQSSVLLPTCGPLRP